VTQPPPAADLPDDLADLADWADDPWKGANPLDPAFRDDPHTPLARLRRLDPVNQTPLGIWRLARYEDCVRLLREVETGVRQGDGTLPGSQRMQALGAGPGRFMLQQDPPDHTRLRKLVSKAFTPRAIQRLRPRVEELVDGILDEVAERGDCDLIATLALPVPSTVICEMMGVPVSDRDRFTEWTAQSTHLLAAQFAPDDVIRRGVAAAGALAGYFGELIAERRRAPREDLLTGLVQAEEAGDRLTEEELLSQCIGLLIAGFETTIGLIGNGARALARHPEQMERLRRDPGLDASAVDECLRYDGPIPLTVRFLREDTRFGDKVVPKDARVMAMLASANRDPERFPEADRFDVGRTPNEHLAFGGGAHFCLGAHLARMEGQVALGRLVRRFGGIELGSDTVEWGPSLFRVPKALPVRVKPAR